MDQSGNMDSVNFYEYKRPKSYAEQKYSEIRIEVLMSVYIIGIVIGVVLKMLVIYSAWKQHQNGLSPLRWFIISLMVAGIIHLLVVLPFQMTETVHPTWKFGDLFCKAYEYQKYVDLYSIAYHLVFICLYLLMGVCRPNFVRVFDRGNVVALTLASGWLIFVIANIPHAFGHGTGSYPNFEKVYCYSKGFHRTRSIMTEWVIANFIFLYLLPGVVMTCSCVCLWAWVLFEAGKPSNILLQPASKSREYAIFTTAATLLFLLAWGIPCVQTLVLLRSKVHPGAIQKDIGNILLHSVLPAALPLLFLLGIRDYRAVWIKLFNCNRQGGQSPDAAAMVYRQS